MIRLISKLFSRQARFHINEYLYYRTKRYLDAYNRKIAEVEDFRWNALFAQGDDRFVHPLPGGLVRINLYRDSLLSRFIYGGNFERNELQFVQAFLRRGDHFVDIGSNLGLYSLIASPIVGPAGRIIAFEPSTRTFQRLQDNVALNGFYNVDTRNLGLSDKPGHLSLNISQTGHDAWNSFAATTADRFQLRMEVPVSTLDLELAEVDREKIVLVKLDVEGWERFVLLGGEKFLKEHDPALIVELTETNSNSAGYRTGDLFDLLCDWGYRWYRFRDGKLIAERKRETYMDDNLIAIRSVDRYRDRVST
jgi:FkbM family methyltransferase